MSPVSSPDTSLMASASSFLGMRRNVPPEGPRKRSTHRRLRPMSARNASSNQLKVKILKSNKNDCQVNFIKTYQGPTYLHKLHKMEVHSDLVWMFRRPSLAKAPLGWHLEVQQVECRSWCRSNAAAT